MTGRNWNRRKQRKQRKVRAWEAEVMEIARQVSVFLENRPGRLAQVLAALAREKVNLLALTVMDHREQGVLRFLANDPGKAVRVLKGLAVPCFEAEVLAVELRNQPGALARICEVLGEEHINIDYAYCSAAGRTGKTTAVLRVSNPERALRVLGAGAGGAARAKGERRPVRDQRAYQPPR
jgi:hypothetical protein